MALKALMIRKRLDAKMRERDALKEQVEAYTAREAELEGMIAEAETEDEQRAVEEEIETFNSNRAKDTEDLKALDDEVRELEEALAAEEAEQVTEPAPAEEVRTLENKIEKRGEIKTMVNRNKFGITPEMVREDSFASFLTTVRDAMSKKRAIENAGLLIPEVVLGMIKENVPEYSKLYKHCYTRNLRGDGKLNILGTIPEAVWEECCGIINEIDIYFNTVKVECNKVAAFIPVCNSILEDSDIALAAEIVEALLISIGKALDKAILYGLGTGMPLGVYTRLAQTSQPAGYPVNARTWVDLHTSNLLQIANSVTGTALFQTILLDSAAMSGKYSRGELVWVMNETTYKFLQAQGMSVNAAGAIVSAVDGRMPVAGGIIEVLDFVPNYNIIAGHFDLYLLADRMNMRVESASQAKFIEDMTVFRGKARYDGQPAIAEAFMGFAINGASFSAPSFTADIANTPAYVILNKNAAAVTAAAGTNHTVQLKAIVTNARGEELKGQTITWASSVEAKATVSTEGLVTGAASGSTVVTASCGDATAVCNVTVS